MAAKIISDNKLDQDLAKYKKEFDNLNRTSLAFMATYAQMSPRERAAQLQQIQSKIREIQSFIITPQAKDLTNAGTRFSHEALKAHLTSYLSRWHKFEKSIG